MTTLARSAVEGWTSLRQMPTAEGDTLADALRTAFCESLDSMVVTCNFKMSRICLKDSESEFRQSMSRESELITENLRNPLQD